MEMIKLNGKEIMQCIEEFHRYIGIDAMNENGELKDVDLLDKECRKKIKTFNEPKQLLSILIAQAISKQLENHMIDSSINVFLRVIQ